MSRQQNPPKYIIYTDGGCFPNPGKGAYAFVVLENGTKLIEESYLDKETTTNNKMEMCAVIDGLNWVKENYGDDHRILVRTDSMYVKNGIYKWAIKWEMNHWLTSGDKPVKNKDLWQELMRLFNSMDVEIQWVKAHNGNHWNEYVDKLCGKLIY